MLDFPIQEKRLKAKAVGARSNDLSSSRHVVKSTCLGVPMLIDSLSGQAPLTAPLKTLSYGQFTGEKRDKSIFLLKNVSLVP